MLRNTWLPGVEVTETRIAVHSLRRARIFLGLTGLVFGAMGIGLTIFLWPSAASLAERAPVDLVSQFVSSVMIPLLTLCFIVPLFLYGAGPYDLILDTEQGTYRFRRGFPGLASWKTGSLQDVAGLRIEPYQQCSGRTIYQLMLEWKNAKPAPWTLGNGPVASRRPAGIGSLTDESRLRLEAQLLAVQMGVPILDKKTSWELARGRMSLLFLLIPAFLLFVFPSLLHRQIDRTLQTQGRTVPGIIIKVYEDKSAAIRYAYRVGGRSFKNTVSVPSGSYDKWDVESPVTVRYLPAYPHTSELDTSSE